jgi:hypothetical protein
MEELKSTTHKDTAGYRRESRRSKVREKICIGAFEILEALVKGIETVETSSHDENSVTSGQSAICLKGSRLSARATVVFAARRPGPCQALLLGRNLEFIIFVTVSTGACSTLAAIISLSLFSLTLFL